MTTAEKPRDWTRKCGIRGCPGLVPPHRTMATGMLCDDHLAPVSNQRIEAWIEKRLAKELDNKAPEG